MAKRPPVNWKALILAHIEKVVCVFIAVGFCMLLWSAISRESIPTGLEPQDIESVAAQANANITSTTWEAFSAKPVMRNFSQESGWYDVPFEPYRLFTAWDPEVFPRQGKREDPKYFGFREVEAHYDQGVLALITGEALTARFGREGAIPIEIQAQIDAARPKPPKRAIVEDTAGGIVDANGAPARIKFPGGEVEDNEVSEGRRWAMVTALLPRQEQIDAYVEAFREKSGFDQKNDTPLYFGYEVERADVTGGVTPEWKLHAKINSRVLLLEMLRWAKSKRTEIIDKHYIQSIFTWPLPPRVLELWGEKDKHSKIPLAGANDRPEEAGAILGEDPLLGMGQREGQDLEELIGGARPRPRVGEGDDDTTPLKMLRYFDFDLLPGHAYQYRFRAVLRDPNYVRDATDGERRQLRVEEKLLGDDVVKRLNLKRQAMEQAGAKPEVIDRLMQITYTEWSDPSPVVKVPPDIYVLAVDAVQPPEGRYNLEPASKIMITTYDRVLGVEKGGETALQRGNLANFIAPNVRTINVDYNTFDYGPQEFNPNAMLLDIRGGATLKDSKLKLPGELLLFNFDQGGKLIVCDEIEDAASVQAYQDRQRKLDAMLPRAAPRPVPTGIPGEDLIKQD